MPIACVYCGGSHPSPADVRACWQQQQDGQPGDAPTRTDVPVRGDPGGVVASAGDRRQHAAEASGAGAQRPEVVARVAASLDMAGPDALGRNLVITPGADVPPAWNGVPRVDLDASSAVDELILTLRQAAIDRNRLVIATSLDPDTMLGESDDRPAYAVDPTFTFPLAELRHLVWSNAIDARDPASPQWGLLDQAAALGARPAASDEAGDVIDASGRALWLDGGPIGRVEPIDGVPVVHAVAIEHGSLTPPRSTVERGELGTIDELAADQHEAVVHDGGAARIIAPAGSGKTRVLTERARHLLGEWLLPSTAVSLVAFNKRAQIEMQQRTGDLPGLQVRTLNAIALAIINGTPPFAPQRRAWKTVDEPEVRRIIGQLVRFPRRRNTDPVAPWLEALSVVRLGLRDPDDVEVEYGGDVDGLADVWPKFRSALEHAHAVDFDDQIYRAIELLLRDPDARQAAQRASRLLLVDEFQDLTPAHVLLVRLLAGPGAAVFGVGDDDQTIYGYNGADPAWLIDFSSLFPGSGDHPLTVNYRCPSDVVEAADRLLRHNQRRVPKSISAASQAGGGLDIARSQDAIDETITAVTSALDNGTPSGDIAVLTRVNSLLAPVQAALTERGVAISGGVGSEFLSRTAVRAVLAWFRLASGADGGGTRGRGFGDDDLREALRRPSRSLHPRIADWVAEQHDIDGLRRLAGRLTSERDARRVNEFASDIAALQRQWAGSATTERIVRVLVDDVGLRGSVATLDHSRRGMNRAAQSDDLTAVLHLAALHPDVATFESWLQARLQARRSGDGIVLATIHRVKGQEWPEVVVHLAGADQFPHRLAEDTEEERRLFHVAITRASRHVTVVPGPESSPFVDQLFVEPEERATTDEASPSASPAASSRSARRRSTRNDRQASPASDDPLVDRSTVLIAPGMVLVDSGREWTIESVDAGGAVALQGDASRRFDIGVKVATAGRQRGALHLSHEGLVEPVVARAFDDLRVLRERLRNGKPAYVVFDDKTLAGIARAMPQSLDELADIRGVGPAKLEQYGDDVLGVIAAAGTVSTG